MASADIEKLAVADARIVQPQPRYAVQKGSLALTNAPYIAIAANASQHTYNINAPSQNVFVARDVDWQCEGVCVRFDVDCTVSGTTAPTPGATPIIAYGRDFALAPYPLHQMVQTMTATINDTTTTINLSDVLDPVLRLTDYKPNRLIKNSPAYLDTYAKYSDAAGAINNPLGAYNNATEFAEQPNGAWAQWEFCNPDTGAGFGVPGAGSNTTYSYGTQGVVTVVSGIPTVNSAANKKYTVAIRFSSTERLIIPPFIFNDEFEGSVGYFGINNIQMVMNLKSNIDRVIRWVSGTVSGPIVGRAIDNVRFCDQKTFSSAKLQVQYLTPSLAMDMPTKSVVPYLEFPRYINASLGGVVAPLKAAQFQSQTIVLPQIPDMLVIYAKPKASQDGSYGDNFMPITRISLNFDNVAGLLSSHTPEELYRMCVNNGLNMDYNQWRGLASRVTGGAATGAGAAYAVQTAGGFLVLRPGKDFALQTGQAPGLLGNYVLQFNVDINNTATSGADVEPALYVMAVNSGFFETMAGSSRVVKGVLSEADILNAPMMGDDMSLSRMVGGGFMDKLGSFLTKAKDIYTASKPAVSAVKGMLPDSGALGKVKGALGAVGYGQAGAGLAGAGKRRKSISSRLM
jgi:hypothetical protein